MGGACHQGKAASEAGSHQHPRALCLRGEPWRLGPPPGKDGRLRLLALTCMPLSSPPGNAPATRVQQVCVSPSCGTSPMLTCHLSASQGAQHCPRCPGRSPLRYSTARTHYGGQTGSPPRPAGTSSAEPGPGSNAVTSVRCPHAPQNAKAVWEMTQAFPSLWPVFLS